jgi:8-oxo-dGTP pyrophosphatase MutT (NUDIX family)
MRERPGRTEDVASSPAARRLRVGDGLRKSRSSQTRRGWLWRRRLRLSLSPLQERVSKELRARQADLAVETDDNDFAAVAVILAPNPDGVLLIRRAERAGDPWSGHFGLPGGRRDPRDRDLLATSLRETVEEVGYVLPQDALLGQLDDVWPRSPIPRLIVVRPYVFAISERPKPTLSDEVAETFWVSLEELAAPGVYRDTVVRLRGESRPFPAYHLRQGIVWGLTERILTQLVGYLSPDR